jgi:hypothetical protein
MQCKTLSWIEKFNTVGAIRSDMANESANARKCEDALP